MTTLNSIHPSLLPDERHSVGDKRRGLLARLTGWFRRGRGAVLEGHSGNGVPAAAGTMLASPREPRGPLFRRRGRRDAIEGLEHGISALGELMTGIRDHLEQQSRRQDELLQYLSHLPAVLQQLPESQRVQGEALRGLHQQQGKLVSILERIAETESSRGRSLDTLQQRAETYDRAVTEHLSGFGVAMQSVGKSSEASAQVLEQLREHLTTRDAEMQRTLHRHNARFTAMMAAALALSVAAVGAVAATAYVLVTRIQG